MMTTETPRASCDEETLVRHYEYDAYDRLLDEDGFFVWPKLIPADLIDAHLDGLEEAMRAVMVERGETGREVAPATAAALKRERSRFHREHPATLDLIFRPQLIAFLRHRFGDTPVMRQPQTGHYQQHSPAHTESLDIKPNDGRAEVRAWCALEDVDPDAGAVYYVPRSHAVIAATLEERLAHEYPDFLDTLRTLASPTTRDEYGELTGAFFRDVKKRILPDLIAEHGLRRVAPLLEKGDVVVFRTDVVHGTAPCRRPDRTRKYMTVFWSAKETTWYQTRAWWGPAWDYRCVANSISANVEEIAVGSRINFEQYFQAYLASFGRQVQVC